MNERDHSIDLKNHRWYGISASTVLVKVKVRQNTTGFAMALGMIFIITVKIEYQRLSNINAYIYQFRWKRVP